MLGKQRSFLQCYSCNKGCWVKSARFCYFKYLKTVPSEANTEKWKFCHAKVLNNIDIFSYSRCVTEVLVSIANKLTQAALVHIITKLCTDKQSYHR